MSRPSQSGQGAAPTPSVRRSGDDVLVRLDFTDEVAYYAWIERLRSASPILRLAERLDEGARLRIESVHGAQRDELVAEVRQVFRSGADLWGTLIEVCEDEAGEESPDGPQESAEPSAEPDGKQGGEGEVEGDPDPDDDDETTRRGETYGASAFFELQKLNPNQKMMLATRANRQQRQLLLRDTSQAIQMALLSNPRLESKELLEIARNPQTTGGVLQRLANDQRWGSNYEVQLALVRNPQTPSPIAIRLLELMRTSDLRFLAKSQALRENVRKAALRVYLKRAP